MNFCLIWLERNTFTVYANIARLLISGRPPVRYDFPVLDRRQIEERIVIHGDKQLEQRMAADVAVDKD